MRHLIACRGCQRQYDATGLDPGSTLACRCGTSVEVRAPRSHDAAVVRCSSCGATRQEGTPACGFCSSDFTLHEQDLHTICPGCLTRIADRARFCHACGVALAPQPAASAGLARPCPNCAPTSLEHRALPGGPPLMECPRCMGFWIEPHELRGLVARATQGGQAARLIAAAGAGRPPAPPPAAPGRVLYLPCPVCATRMNRKRFPGRAAVIVDICREHGFWFDAHELDQVLLAAERGLGDRADATLPGDEPRRRQELRLERERAWRAEGPLRADAMADPLASALRFLGDLLLH